MKKVLYGIVAVLAGVLIAQGAQAQENKFAYIDAQRLLLESVPGKAAAGQMEKLQKDKQAQLEKIDGSIKKLGEQLAAKTPAMSEKAKNDLEDQYQRELRDRERFLKDAQDELRKKEAALIKPIRDDLDKIIDEYGRKNNIDLILDVKSPGVIYASDRIDITSVILEIYNKQAQAKPAAVPAAADKGKKKP
ncbi:MAG: OmpH family outer membrane protein [Syntrophaceae bacterium]